MVNIPKGFKQIGPTARRSELNIQDGEIYFCTDYGFNQCDNKLMVCVNNRFYAFDISTNMHYGSGLISVSGINFDTGFFTRVEREFKPVSVLKG